MITCVACDTDVGLDDIEMIDDFLYVECPHCGATVEYSLRKIHLKDAAGVSA